MKDEKQNPAGTPGRAVNWTEEVGANPLGWEDGEYTDNTEAWKALLQVDPDSFLERDRKGKGWICPVCGSGSGPHGTGMTRWGSDDHPVYHCWACGQFKDAITLYGLARGLIASEMDRKEWWKDVAAKMAKEFGIPWDPSGRVDFDEINQLKGESVRAAAKKSREDVGTGKDLSSYFFRCNYILLDDAEGEPGRDYLHKREISLEMAKRFNLGFDPDFDPEFKGRGFPAIIIPISPYNCFVRVLPGFESIAGDKYVKIKGTHQEIFNFDAVRKPGEFVFITEGAFDALSIMQYGFSALALPMANAGIQELERRLHEVEPKDKTFILCLDSDQAGQTTAQELEKMLERAGYKFYSPKSLLKKEADSLSPGYKDANEAAIADPDGFGARLDRVCQEARKAPKADEIPEGKKTGKARIDSLTIVLAQMKGLDLPLDAIKASLETLNANYCYPPLTPEELESEVITKYTRIKAKTPKSAIDAGEEAAQMVQAEPLEFMSALDLQHKHFDEREWLIKGILPAGGLAMICADPKSYKSWMCLDIGNCIANGMPFMANGKTFPGFKTSQGTVLYFDLETDLQSDHERLQLMDYDGYHPSGENLQILANPQSVRTFGTGLESQLIQRLEDLEAQGKEKPKLIIMDTLQMVKGSSGKKNQNAYEKDVEELKRIRDWAYMNEVTVLVVHHTNKTGQGANVYSSISGSNGTFGTVTTAWLIKQQNGFGELHVTGKAVQSESYKICFDSGSHRWKCEGTLAEFTEKTEVEELEEHPLYYVLCQLADMDKAKTTGFTAREIVDMARLNYEVDLEMSPKMVGTWMQKQTARLQHYGLFICKDSERGKGQSTGKRKNTNRWIIEKGSLFVSDTDSNTQENPQEEPEKETQDAAQKTAEPEEK